MGKILKIGHRGAKGHLAENTLESIKAALKMGVDAIEIDVHLCKTGELVVIHDFTLDRTTNGSGEVKQKSFSELRLLRIEGRYAIPTLSEVLDLTAKKCLINIELKGKNTAAAVCETVVQYVNNKEWNYRSFLISSFDEQELLQVYELNKEIPVAVLTENNISNAVQLAEKINAVAIHPSAEIVNVENVKNIQKKGFIVNVWTVNEPAEIFRMKEMGVDGIISDYPDRL